jgi:hypothetical protein
MVVYAVWDGVARVRFPAPRQIENDPASAGSFSIVDKGAGNRKE